MVEAYKGEEKVNSAVVSEVIVSSIQKLDDKIKIISGTLEIDLSEIVGIGG